MQRKGKAAISMGFVSSEMVNEELSSFVRKCFALTQELVQHWEGLWNQSWQLLCTPTHWAWPNSIIVSHWHFSLCEIKLESMKLPWRLVNLYLTEFCSKRGTGVVTIAVSAITRAFYHRCHFCPLKTDCFYNHLLVCFVWFSLPDCTIHTS